MPNEEQFRDPVPLQRIRLDPQNPRLPRDLQDRSPDGLLAHFAKHYNLVELARSIADKGFRPRYAEALLVIEDPPDSGTFIAVEGNRRLATLILLTDGVERRRCGLGPEWDQLAIDAEDKNLTEVPIIVYPSREALDDYLGFRHITGPTPWRPEAKARFIARLLQQGEPVAQVVRRIGSNRKTVQRFAEAHAVFTQAAASGLDMSSVEAGFGVFYNALDGEGVRGFIGLPPQRPDDYVADPVPDGRIEALGELVALLFGDDERKLKRVIDESRDLRKLSDVLKDEVSTASLLRDRDLDRAWRAQGGGRTELLALVRDLHLRLAEVNGQAQEFRNEPTVREQVARLYRLARDTAERYGLVEGDGVVRD